MIRILDDPEALARAVVEEIARVAAAATASRGGFRIGLSGGTTPARAYDLLVGRVDWSRAEILFADERALPPEDPLSNYRLVRERLLEPARVPSRNVRRMRGEAPDLEEAAREYEPFLATPLDWLLLGVGADGHTASIFPGSPLVSEAERRVAVVLSSPKPPPRRLTVTPRVFAEARRVAVMAAGSDKATAVWNALRGDVQPSQTPARLLRERDWYLDSAAASRLHVADS